MSTLGNKTTGGFSTISKQSLTGDGGTSYTLQQSVNNENELEVYVNNTRQEPTTAYTAQGTTLTMTGAVNASDSFYVIFQGKAVVSQEGIFGNSSTRFTSDNVTIGGTLGVTGATTLSNTLGVTGDLTVDTNTLHVDASNNRVGIGETSPQTKLHIKTADASATADANSAVVIEGTDATRADLQFLGDGTSFQSIYFGDNADPDVGRIAYDHTGNSMRFNVNGAEHMRIDSSGNVGIGTPTPSSFGALTDNLVIGTTSGENGMSIVSGSGNSGRIQFTDDGSFRGAIEYAHSNDFLYFYTAGSQRLKITNQGYIQSPVTASNTTGSSANMHVTSGGEFAKSTSSKRYKNTINDATHGLKELLQLRSVTFKHNSDSETVYGGLIAEEVHDVGLTEFVEYNDSDKPESIHYTHMISLTIKSIQELSAKVTALETENATQATQIADLIARVTALESE